MRISPSSVVVVLVTVGTLLCLTGCVYSRETDPYSLRKDLTDTSRRDDAPAAFSMHDLEVLLEGVLEGAFDGAASRPSPEFGRCLANGEHMIDQVDEAVHQIIDGMTVDNTEEVEEGIQLLGKVLQEASQEVLDCEIVADDSFRALYDIAEAFHHPFSFLWHAGRNILINHVEITEELNAALEHWQKQPRDYRAFGFNVGESLEQVFHGNYEYEAEVPDEEETAAVPVGGASAVVW